jgi:prepilin-type N-terminal cleavage/methylation domain-containing protein
MSSSDARERTRRSASSGFTLIEVLAAVALLGILYAVVARVAIEGLRAEGDSARRLEASLLADERVNDLIGAPVPAVGHSETIDGDYTIMLDVTPFSLPQQWGLAGAESATPLLLAPAPGGDGLQALRTVQFTIHWLEGGNERHISRTLFLVDFTVASQLASTAAQAGAAVSPGDLPPPLTGTPDETPPEAPEEP